ncbi:hypothetical protein ACTJJE_10950 [Mycolicibacterium sp. 22603]|uniref:hypothetical protein n=1 Tax=Mycolicibacterium sp. 22603 TaxID=3453950 RepID=UPI003F85419E
MLLEFSERWPTPWFTGAFLIATTIAVATGMTRIAFLGLLVAATGYVAFFQFPEVANHVNLMLCLNIAMIGLLSVSLLRRRYSADDDYALIAPVLRISLMLTYALAGFHKLNSDYFDTASSCAAGILTSVIRALQTDLFGIPVVVPIALGAAYLGYRLARRGRFGVAGNRLFTMVTAAVGLAGLTAVAVVVFYAHLGPLLTAIGLIAAIAVLGWELGGGLLLAVPRLQACIVAFALTMHAALALIGFVDFGSMAAALLFAFLPASYRQVLIDGFIRLGGHSLSRVCAYVGMSIAIALVSGLNAHLESVAHWTLISGIVFDAAVLIVIWPILAAVSSPSQRPEWGGVRIIDARTPVLLYLVPAVLIAIALTPYLGLRTAGNFSMFSNLRTEGERSNHLLLGGNPLKIWGYQEDIVWIIDIDDRYGDVIHHYDAGARGYALPVVEFRKWIHDWDQAGYRVPLTYGYRGIRYTTDDIVTDPMWRTPNRTLPMVLLDFRVIQPGEPNYCRW